ncbi:MAG TPA: DUF4190 domain-containing protein [Pilimelia sp.]|jgi:Domain of unknown function (DUF4190)|nr:DUF4190 domain-containing protein [Pilimelia sp.]
MPSLEPAPVSPGHSPPAPPPDNTLGVIAMCLGIAAIPLTLVVIGLPLGIGAIVLGVLAKQRVDRGQATNRDQSIAGLACGVLAVFLTVLLIARPDS